MGCRASALMDLRSELNSTGKRMSELADRFEAELRRWQEAAAQGKSGHPLDDGYWRVRDLLAPGMTRDGLRDLDRDARDTFRFLVRHIDFAELQKQPPYRRYPILIWKIFLATVSRLTPPRRVAFTVAIVSFLLGSLQIFFSGDVLRNPTGIFWLIVSVSIFFVLLLIELRDKLSLKGDLEIAREIQFGLVPAQPIRTGRFSVHATMRPANTVGGDYYDVIDLSEGSVGIVVGDVAGKGMPAALMMALLQGSLRTLVTAGLRGEQLIGKLNDYFVANTPANKLVTLFFGDFQPESGRLRYVNAGHNAPFLIRKDGRFERLDATSTVIGISPGLAFEARETYLQSGDRLVLYTDGITEAFNPAEEEYGEQRLVELVLARRSAPQEELIAEIVRSVVEFCGSTRPGDDITVMILQRS